MNNHPTIRAGVIPYMTFDDGIVRMLFMKARSNPEAGWQIAKGGVEKGETIREGAFREASEELGLFEPNCLTTEALGNYGGIHLWIAEIDNGDLFGLPCEQEVVAVSWLTYEEANALGRKIQKHIITDVYKRIMIRVTKSTVL